MGDVKINTVTGPISPDDLGVTLVHEHVLFGYPGWEGDRTIAPFDREELVNNGVATLKTLKDLGLQSFIDATPTDGGRDVEILKEVSEKSEVHVICSTGYYAESEGSSAYWKFRGSMGDVSGEIYELFLKEVTVGIMKTGIKAGVIKVGSSKGEITNYEQLMFATAARVQKESGAPIITHTEAGTMGPQQAELLISQGANPKRIQIGHMGDNLDPDYQKNTLKQGVFAAWDRMGLQGLVGCPMDEQRYDAMTRLVRDGYTDQLMISHDFIISWLGRPPNLPQEALPLVANWHPTHLFKNIIPELEKRGVSEDQIKTLVVDNPRRLFSGK